MFFKKPSFFFWVLLGLSSVALQGFNNFAADRIIMKDGTVQEGLIVKNDATFVVLEQLNKDRIINRRDIARIDDANKDLSYFSDLTSRDKAPPWRMMVQDMRCNDAIKSFVQIPPTRISTGYLRNIPYLSFHVNRHAEMNIYGDPNNPVCVEVGSYDRGEKLKIFQSLARQFFAGYIGPREGVKTLYQLDLHGDKKRVGKFIYRVVPQSDPQSMGGWWLSIYDPVRLEKARVSEARYLQMTLPSDKVREKNGMIKSDLDEKYRHFLNSTMMQWLGKLPGFRGFYRDDQNKLQVLKTTHG